MTEMFPLPSLPTQFLTPQLTPELAEVASLIRVPDARRAFGVDGQGLAAAVIDTGINRQHVDFEGRIAAERNFTSDNGGDPSDASDGHGHGTHVAGIVAAAGNHRGMAPAARLVALKALPNETGASTDAVEAALQWVVDNHAEHHVGVVCMSLGDTLNHRSDEDHRQRKLAQLVRSLTDSRVVVVVAAGNHYAIHGSRQGMSFPAILQPTISVGAVFDANVGHRVFPRVEAEAFSTRADQITPFSQRLHPRLGTGCFTKVFAPGSAVLSSGILGELGESLSDGTSQAAPVVAGLILLMQDFFIRHVGQRPQVSLVERLLRQGSVSIVDGDDEHDNVDHAGDEFLRVDAVKMLTAARDHLVHLLGTTAQPLAALSL